jgi:hypothetical protein
LQQALAQAYGQPVLCTVILQTYRQSETKQVHEALNTLMPVGHPDWSRKGIYAYWDPETHELLYVGLASSLPDRFAQHNALVRHGGGNKSAEIADWFAQHPKLGVTTMVQAAAIELLKTISDINPSMGGDPKEIIGLAEGQLIELARVALGKRPRWNKTGGARRGSGLAEHTEQSFIHLLCAARDSLLIARRSLTDLVADEQALRYEATLHSARMRAVLASHDVRGLPSNQGEISRRIEQLLHVRAGHLIDDLAPTDSDIIDWLRRLEDGRAELELQAMLVGTIGLQPMIQLPEDQAINLLHTMVFAQGANSPEAATAREILAGRYLTSTPAL